MRDRLLGRIRRLRTRLRARLLRRGQRAEPARPLVVVCGLGTPLRPEVVLRGEDSALVRPYLAGLDAYAETYAEVV